VRSALDHPTPAFVQISTTRHADNDLRVPTNKNLEQRWTMVPSSKEELLDPDVFLVLVGEKLGGCF
jgi:hypothetical protein